MQNADVCRMTQCLVNNAVAFGKANQCGELFFTRISVQIEVQSNLFESDRNVLGDAERTTKIQIALCANFGVAQWNAKSGRDCGERTSWRGHR